MKTIDSLLNTSLNIIESRVIKLKEKSDKSKNKSSEKFTII